MDAVVDKRTFAQLKDKGLSRRLTGRLLMLAGVVVTTSARADELTRPSVDDAIRKGLTRIEQWRCFETPARNRVDRLFAHAIPDR
jgi:hypothetical protein